jgi:hydrogenase expression/formation protein HypC
MCLSVPVRVLEVHDRSWATVDLGGVTKRVSIDLIEDVSVGDYVLMHVGFAIQKVDEEDAQKTLALFEDMLALVSDPDSEVPARPDPSSAP